MAVGDAVGVVGGVAVVLGSVGGGVCEPLLLGGGVGVSVGGAEPVAVASGSVEAPLVALDCGLGEPDGPIEPAGDGVGWLDVHALAIRAAVVSSARARVKSVMFEVGSPENRPSG